MADELKVLFWVCALMAVIAFMTFCTGCAGGTITITTDKGGISISGSGSGKILRGK